MLNSHIASLIKIITFSLYDSSFKDYYKTSGIPSDWSFGIKYHSHMLYIFVEDFDQNWIETLRCNTFMYHFIPCLEVTIVL